MTKNNDTGTLLSLRNRNEFAVNTRARIHWRASLVPAAAVTPAPIAYTKVAAVKKLVVGFLMRAGRPSSRGAPSSPALSVRVVVFG